MTKKRRKAAFVLRFPTAEGRRARSKVPPPPPLPSARAVAALADALYMAVARKLLNNLDRPGVYRDSHDSAMEEVAEAARAYRTVRYPNKMRPPR